MLDIANLLVSEDFFWGVCNGKGENHLGKILMKVRDEIRGIEKKTGLEEFFKQLPKK